MSKLSRREFLKVSALVVGGSVLVCGGAGALAAKSPTIIFPDESYGEEKMSEKNVLVAYSSKCGSTAEVAEKIGAVIAARGFRVDVKPASAVDSLKGYQSVILGSAIRMGSWLPEMLTMAKKHQAELAGLPVSIFTVHLQNTEDTPEARQARDQYIAPIKAVVPAKSEVFFAGRTDFSKMSFFDKTICKMMKAVEEDKRDWKAIEAWADTTATAM
jgi:menaquinone-dependent protoporphyrinogen oxidase